MSEKETYLGDGLYVRFDGWGYRLRAPRMYGGKEVSHEVYLEPHVLRAFMEFVETVKGEKAGRDGQ